MLKMRRENGKVIVTDGMKEYCFGEGNDGIRRAMHYIELKRFFARVDGKRYTTRIDTAYPVRSLIPTNLGKKTRYVVRKKVTAV